MSADGTWFHSWGPPPNLVAELPISTTSLSHHDPLLFGNFTSHHHNTVHHTPPKSYGPGPQPLPNFFPVFLQMGLLTYNNQNPSSRRQPPSTEKTGPFRTVYHWNELDFAYPTPEDRELAIQREDFIPKNNLPLGVEVYRDRIFVSMPKWKDGVPASLAVLPKVPQEASPLLRPYPDWAMHTTESCQGLTSVFRMYADTCGRLWVLDSGQIHVTTKPEQICPPQLFIFNLETDQLLLRYPLPKEFIKQDSLYSNLIVDIRNGDCANAHAYMADVWRFGLVVFSLKRVRSWRITDHLFYPEPLAAAYNVQGLEFEWTDGLFGFSLSQYDPIADDRLLYFHPMSSFRQFYVKTSIIRDEYGWNATKNVFNVFGQSRGKSGQVSAAAMDRKGVMFYNLVTRDSVGCWDSRKSYKRTNLGVVAESSKTLVFPNDLKVDNEERQSVWVLSNRLPFYLYKTLDPDDINFRIMTAYTDEAVRGNICDPKVAFYDSFQDFPDGEDCY